jgi:hypothetical protein
MNRANLAAGAFVVALTALGPWWMACSIPSTGQILPTAAAPPAANPDTTGWVLVYPPLRPYASDRTPQMGGPLALPAGWPERRSGGSDISIDRIDTSAPLSKWQRAGMFSFTSQKDCEDARQGESERYNDPRYVAQGEPRTHDLLVDPVFMKELVADGKCVEASSLTGAH